MATWILDPTLSIDDTHRLFGKPSLDTKASESTLANESLDRKLPLPSADYVIVGGGTAGLALAYRLAAGNSKIKVMVLEAGVRSIDPVVNVPGLYGQAMQDPRYDWSYKTVPQKELNNREIESSAGRVLGGSSAINFSVFMRASAPEYDAWSQFAPGWDFSSLLPFFRKKESYTAPKWDTDQIFPGVTLEEDEHARKLQREFFGEYGPIHSNNNDMYSDLEKPTIKTLNAWGIKTNRLQGYGDSTGIFNINTSVDRSTGTRSYAGNTYGDPQKKPQNLTILTSTYVTRVLFSDIPDSYGNKVAVGVELTLTDPISPSIPNPGPIVFTIKAIKEVIISAGTYNTPRVLELSGVGNPRILKAVGITTIIDLPGVGENLQEHPFIVTDFVVKDGVFTFDRLRNDPMFQQEQILRYQENGTGAYATTVAAYGYVKLNIFLSEEEIKELIYELEKEIDAVTNPYHKQQLYTQLKYLSMPDVGDVEIIMVPKAFATYPPAEGKSYISFAASIVHIVPRGKVHIKSNNPMDVPNIDPRYMTSAFDLKVLVKFTQFMRKITETQPLADLIVCPSTPPASVSTYDQFEKFVRNGLTSLQHPVGTASMAPRDIGGVISEKLIVHGTKNLRVADMSIAPIHIATHTCETAYAIGEKAFAIIESDNSWLD